MNGNRIKGFLKYNEIEYGFFFADEELLLFPCNEEQRMKDTKDIFDMFIAGRPQPRKVIRKILISGTTSDGKMLYFRYLRTLEMIMGICISRYMRYIYIQSIIMCVLRPCPRNLL